MVKTSKVLVGLSLVTAVLAAIAAAAGLGWPEAGESFSFLTARGQTVVLHGQGLYRYESRFIGAGFRGQDWITLLLAIPALVLATVSSGRGSLRGSLLLLGLFGYFLYVYASMALAAAFNPLFLVYVGAFSASLFGLVCAFGPLASHLSQAGLPADLPRRGPAVYLLISGAMTLIVWLSPIVPALLGGRAPVLLDHYTTTVTYALDLGVIVPSTFLAGTFILCRDPRGYLLAFPLITTIVLLGPVIALSTYFQVRAGVSFTPAEIIGPIAGFVLLGGLGVGVLASLLRRMAVERASRATSAMATATTRFQVR
jgi:hypothetical protein